MRSLLFGLAFATLSITPSVAALEVGATAPDFTATASLGGKEFKFHLYEALKKGPVVVYFYPSAYTQGCDLEAHTFADNSGRFKEVGAGIIGVSGDNLERLNHFSADPNFCAGKFPIAADETLHIARAYGLATQQSVSGVKDINGAVVAHGIIERVTFVVNRKHRIVAAMSSRNDVDQKINQMVARSRTSSGQDALTPDQHVQRALEIVRALPKHPGQ